MTWLVSAAGAFTLTWGLLQMLSPWGRRVGLTSRKSKSHDAARTPADQPATPCVGGLALMAGVAIVFGASVWARGLPLPQWCIGLATGAGLMTLFGLLDDRFQFRARWLLLVQCVAAIGAYAAGVQVEIASLPQPINFLLTIFWLVVMSNAMNLMDILDGLAGGVALISSVGFSLAALLTGQQHVGLLAATLSGALAGFVLMNFHPARVYLGNHGSLALGFCLSAMALPISYAPLGREMALFAPVLILGFPLIDLLYVVVMRLSNGRSIWKGSRDHLALRLMALNWSERSVVLFMYVCSMIFMCAGLSLIRLGNVQGLTLLIGALALVGVIAVRAARVSISTHPHV